MNNEQLLQIIAQAAQEGALELDLSGKGLTSLPPEISQLTNLRKLNLSSNQLTNLPAAIAQLSNLRELNLRHNQLTSLPVAIAQLSNLTVLRFGGNQLTSLPPAIAQLSNLITLDLSGNQLTNLPAAIAQLTNLRELDLRHNQLTSLPAAIAQLTLLITLNLRGNQLPNLPTAITQLSNLQRLYLSDNQLTSLPAAIAQLSNLQRLDLSHNQLTSFPTAIVQLSNLQRLYLRGNQLTSLPAAIAQLSNLQRLNLDYNQLTSLPAAITQLSNLRELNLSGNKLTSLPDAITQLTNLQRLHLSRNQLTSLPLTMAQLTSLKTLDLMDNPLPIPPEILSQIYNPAEIINYYHHVADVADETRSLNEAKMIIVGQGGVGKTSLVKRLVHGVYNPHEGKTEGIHIRRWPIIVDDEEIRLNILDFGGQEIMHATHQFFLTQRSLYVLVLDARQGEQEGRLEYWLNLVESFGGDSPIIVVVNKVDAQPLDLDRRGLRRKYGSIKGFVETSCVTGEGIDRLQTLISQEVGQLEHIHDKLRESWFAVKAQLEAMEQDYIPYSEYQRLCQAQQVTDELSQRTLLRLLHDWGIVLNFHDDARLEDTNILNPEWVTQGVYSILNHHSLFHSQGVLEREQLDNILDPIRYPRSKHNFILEMMRYFELCFRFPDEGRDKFLIPDLLPKEEPDLNWPQADSLAFQYHYNFLPNSIISRFIVRMHSYISQKTNWRSGVVLAHEGNKALVNADIEGKKIFIFVIGNQGTRREFLAIIRAEFGRIHHTIERLHAKEKVPLPDYPTVVVDYQHLRTLERKGVDEFIPEGLDEMVHVRGLLSGVDTESARHELREGQMQALPRANRPFRVTGSNRGPSLPAPVQNAGALGAVPAPRTNALVQQLVNIKAGLDKKAQREARRNLGLYFGLLATIWAAVIGGLTYYLGWGVMEPWAYFLGVGVTIGGYAYFALTEREFSPSAIYEQMLESKKLALYEEASFDLEQYERLAQAREGGA